MGTASRTSLCIALSALLSCCACPSPYPDNDIPWYGIYECANKETLDNLPRDLPRLHLERVSAEYVPTLLEFRQLHTLLLTYEGRFVGRYFDDECAAILKNHPAIRFLAISECMLTDQGLLELAALRELRWLYISSDAITPQGTAQFRALRPCVKLDIVPSRYPPPPEFDEPFQKD